MLAADFSFSFRQMFKDRESLWRETSKYKTKELRQAVAEGLVGTIKRVLRMKTTEVDQPLNELLARYAGLELSAEVMSDLIWRLAAGAGWMRHGRVLATTLLPVSDWFDPWVPMWIEGVRYAGASLTGKQLMGVAFRVLKGPFGGLAFSQQLPHSYLTRKFAWELGFTLFRRMHFGELVGCVLVGSLIFEGQKVRLDEVGDYANAKRFNARLRCERAKPCGRDYRWLCHECSMGYEGANSCPRGTHKVTWVLRACPRCEQEAWSDPESKSRLCVSCSTAEFRARLNSGG